MCRTLVRPRAPVHTSPAFVEKKMEDMELLFRVSEGRLSPRLFLLCNSHDTYPVGGNATAIWVAIWNEQWQTMFNGKWLPMANGCFYCAIR